jgi:major membrane immunogen (membrane-anchored lipoprotein)
MKKQRIRYVCERCGSSDIYWDASAIWDVDKQEMELANETDQCHCNECDDHGETSTHAIEVTLVGKR